MKFPSVLSRGKKGIRYLIENHKKELVIGLLVLTLVIAVTAAAVYNSMYIQSTVKVEPV